MTIVIETYWTPTIKYGHMSWGASSEEYDY